MADYIDRQAAVDALNKLDVSDGVGISSIACSVQESAISAIQHLPSVDVQTVRNGHWKTVFDNNGYHAICPFCGEWKYHQSQKYCGECGTRMEGE